MSKETSSARKLSTKSRTPSPRIAEITQVTPAAPVNPKFVFTLSEISKNEHDLIAAAWKIIQRSNGRRPVEDYIEMLLFRYVAHGTITPQQAREDMEEFAKDFEETRETVIDFLAQNPSLAAIGEED